MKKSFVWAFAAVVTLGVSLRAMCGKCEGKDCESKKADMVVTRVAELKSQLNLTADQEAKVKAAIEAEVAEKCAHKKAMHEKMGHAHADAAAKIKAVLTPEQQANLDEIHGKGMMPCCQEAAKKGEKCEKCAGMAMKPCCAEAAKKGEKCEKCSVAGLKPCCLEAAKKGEACKKCPPKKAGACCPMMGGESKKK
jgi:Spy/CpxP family protein refolding chaperone